MWDGWFAHSFVALDSQIRHLTADLEQTREQLEEEQEAKVDFQRQVMKLNGEVQQWRGRYECEGLARAEELEEAKRKLAGKLADAEEQVEMALNKCNALEKVKSRLQGEVEDLMVDVERSNASKNLSRDSPPERRTLLSDASAMDKKQKQFDKLINEWKEKCQDVTMELEASQKEARLYSTELFKLKSQYEESHEQIEALRKENQNLAEEIKVTRFPRRKTSWASSQDMVDQLGEGGKNVHEIDKARKRAELEKEELQAALEEAEATIEQEESKSLRVQMELSSIRQEIDRRIHEKDEDFENTRRNHGRALESMQATLEGESRSKAEALKQVRHPTHLRSQRNSSLVVLEEETRIGYQRAGSRSRSRQS